MAGRSCFSSGSGEAIGGGAVELSAAQAPFSGKATVFGGGRVGAV